MQFSKGVQISSGHLHKALVRPVQYQNIKLGYMYFKNTCKKTGEAVKKTDVI